MEWIIVDDGTDCVRDIIENNELIESLQPMKIRYFYENEKMDLGKNETTCMINVVLQERMM